MTKASNSPGASTDVDPMEGSIYSLKVEAELEELDRRADREYLPMDVFVDTRTRKAHFQGSSIRARRARFRAAA